MLVFLDTEFSDFINIQLISIALVSDDGKHEFYAERNDFDINSCSDFVRSEVIPMLGKISGTSCSRVELKEKLLTFFASLPNDVQIATDSMRDRDLLWDALGEGLPPNLDRSIYDLRAILEDPVFSAVDCKYHESQPYHHALHDARAHRDGWAVVNSQIRYAKK